jgi:uncharacterized protein YwgA
MKLVFLSQMEASGAVEELTGSSQPYRFTKYLYGPFSSDLLRDLDSLYSKGLIDQNAISMDQEGKVIQWQYKLTPGGMALALGLMKTHASEVLHALVRKYGTSSTQELLRYVYTQYLRREPQQAEPLHA